MPKLNVNNLNTLSPLIYPESSNEVSTKLPLNDPTHCTDSASVYFGNFYNQKDDLSKIKSLPTPLKKKPQSNATKSEFTHNMILKLEKLTGTANYSRQVTAILNETVEPPNFSIESSPVDNCAPGDDLDTSYPLWYKDPDQMSFFADDKKFNLTRENNSNPIPTDEWDILIATENAKEIQRNRELMKEAIFKKYRKLRKTSKKANTGLNDYTSDSELSSDEITIE